MLAKVSGAAGSCLAIDTIFLIDLRTWPGVFDVRVGMGVKRCCRRLGVRLPRQSFSYICIGALFEYNICAALNIVACSPH